VKSISALSPYTLTQGQGQMSKKGALVTSLSIQLLVHTVRKEDEQPATYGAAKVTN